MPLENWNGKFAGVGNGGWAGNIPYGRSRRPAPPRLRGGVNQHRSRGGAGLDMARFAFEHPEQLIDFAYRSHHETTLTAKALVEAFYGKPPTASYFIGCSSGGYEGLMEAQRFPADYDGIVAGAPANNWTRLMAGDFDASLAVLKDPAQQSSARRSSACCIAAALAACDASDGVTDGVIDDPRRCAFDPATLSCAGTRTADSVPHRAQVEAARRVYGGLKDPTTRRRRSIRASRAAANRSGRNRDPANPFPIPMSHYKWLVFARSELGLEDVRLATRRSAGTSRRRSEARADPERDQSGPARVPAARRQAAAVSRLERSADRAAEQHQLLRERARSSLGGARRRTSFYRLFMAPGMAHCGGGPGPNTFDMQAALEQWVEKGVAPEQIIATH